MRFSSLVPMLQTQNMGVAISWYEDVLGFSLSGSSGQNWCRLTRDQISIMFMQNDHLGSPHATATQYIYVDDVMALWSSIKDRCAAEWGPETMPYGMLEFAIKDPNGYFLSFGQRVASMLSFDRSYVKNAVERARATYFLLRHPLREPVTQYVRAGFE